MHIIGQCHLTLKHRRLCVSSSALLRPVDCSASCVIKMDLGGGGLAGLSHLKLNLRNCEALQNVDGLRGGGGLASLSHLKLNIKAAPRCGDV